MGESPSEISEKLRVGIAAEAVLARNQPLTVLHLINDPSPLSNFYPVSPVGTTGEIN